MVAWTRRKQGLHDMIADTLVLNGRASEFKSNPAGQEQFLQRLIRRCSPTAPRPRPRRRLSFASRHRMTACYD